MTEPTAAVPQPLLTTARLLVRRFVIGDTERFHTYRNDPEVARWQGWSLPYPRESADSLVQEMATVDLFTLGGWTQLAVVLPAAPNTLIGDVGVRMEADEPTAEIGFSLAREHWGSGYGGEMVSAVVDHLFHPLGLARVVAFTHEDNEPAQRVLEQAGLRYITQDGDEFVYYRRAE